MSLNSSIKLYGGTYVEVAQGRTFLLAEVYKDNITVGIFRYF